MKALHTPQFPVNFYSFILPHFPLTSEASPSQFSGSLPKCSHFQVHSYRLPTTFRFTPTDCPLLASSLLQIAHYFQVHSYRLPTTFRFTLKACPHTQTLSEIRLYHLEIRSTRFLQLNTRRKEALLFKPFSKIRNIKKKMYI